jgi:methylthioribose-1-phosphate isomerase
LIPPTIERRDAAELGEIPPGVVVDNRAFDVPPAALITGYITEMGVTPRR